MPFLCSKDCGDFTAKGKVFYICLQGHIGSELLPLPTTFSPPSLPPTTWTAYSPWKTSPCSYFRVFALAGPTGSARLPPPLPFPLPKCSYPKYSHGSSLSLHWVFRQILFSRAGSLYLLSLFPALCFLYNSSPSCLHCSFCLSFIYLSSLTIV